ncbi:MAG: aminopeptidase P N-terminal domain-containing protein, partial [Gallionella sp.]
MNNFDPNIFSRRRAALQSKMQHGIAVIFAAPEAVRNGDAHYAYRHDSNFFYLTGFGEPEAVLVLIAGDKPQSILFCREKNLEREIWDGHRHGPDAACANFAFDAAYPIAQLDEKLTELMANQPALFYPLGANSNVDQRIIKLRAAVQEKSRSGIRAPDVIHDVSKLLNELRLFKDQHELGIMRRAAAISCGAHQRAMQFTRAGQFEYQVEAELLHEFCRHGARD